MAPAYGFQAEGRGRRRRQETSALMTLLVPLGHHIARLPNKPPVTLALVGLMVALYLQPQGFEFVPSTDAACLQPYRVLEGQEWGRVMWSGLLHADDLHVYYNMASLLWKGVVLEPALGSARFAVLVAELLLVSQLLLVLLARALAAVAPALAGSYYSACAVGFSGVLFALKVVLNARSPDMETVYGVRLPAKYVAWAELVFISLVTPNASFLGHLAGILAGLAHLTLFDRGPAASAGGFMARLGRRLRRLFTFRRSYSGAARYAQSGGGVPGASAGNSAGAAGAGGAAAAGAGGAAAAGGGLGEPPPEDADAADVAAQVRRQRERFYAQQGVSGCGSRRGARAGGGGNGSFAPDLGPMLDPLLRSAGLGGGRSGRSSGGGGRQTRGGAARSSSAPSAAATGLFGSIFGSVFGLAGRARRPVAARAGGGGITSGGKGILAAALAVAAAAWAARPGPESFAQYASRAAHKGFGRWPGLAVASLLRLQRSTGMGLRFYNLGVATVARYQGLWFGGAFGHWTPLPSPWLVGALLPSAPTLLAVAFLACYLVKRAALPATVVRHLEVGPGAWPAAYLLAGLCHDSAARAAAAALFTLAAGRRLEAAVGGGARFAAIFMAGTVVVYALMWAAQRRRRVRLWRACGSGPGLAALLAFATVSAPGTVILTVPRPPALGELPSRLASNLAPNLAAGGALGAVYTAVYTAVSSAAANAISRMLRRLLAALGLPAFGQWAAAGGDGGGGGGYSGARDSKGGHGYNTRSSRGKPATSAPAGAAAAGRRQAPASQRPSKPPSSSGRSSTKWQSAAAGVAIFPLRLTAVQLLAAMAAPALLSLVPAFVAWAVEVPGLFQTSAGSGAGRHGRPRGSTAAARRAMAAAEALVVHAAGVTTGLAMHWAARRYRF